MVAPAAMVGAVTGEATDMSNLEKAKAKLEKASDKYVKAVLEDMMAEWKQPLGNVGGWQPIETAPMDGTDILLWFGHSVGWISLCKWYQKKKRGWCWVCSYDHKAHLWEPTHWMPLPEPPMPETDEEARFFYGTGNTPCCGD